MEIASNQRLYASGIVFWFGVVFLHRNSRPPLNGGVGRLISDQSVSSGNCRLVYNVTLILIRSSRILLNKWLIKKNTLLKLNENLNILKEPFGIIDLIG